MNYLLKIFKNSPKSVKHSAIDMAVPHQAISPREILDNWVKNDDADSVIHERTEDWNGDDIHPNSIREFEDNFDAMEYVADMTSRPVTLDNVGIPSPSEPPAEPPAEPPVEPPTAD